MVTKFCFGFGAAAPAAVFVTIPTFGWIYYNQALRLETDLIGWGMFLAISLFLFFTPPDFLTAVQQGETLPPQVPLFLWMTFWHIIVRLSLTLYLVPHLALGAEISSDYNERASIFSYDTMIGQACAHGLVFIAWRMLEGETIRAYDGESVPAQLDVANYPPIVFLACTAVVVGIWACAFGTRKEIPHLVGPATTVSKFTPWEIIKDIIETFKNRNYVMLLLGLFLLEITKGTLETLGTFINTYFWAMEGTQLKWFGLSAVAGYVSGAFAAPYAIRKVGKRTTCVSMVATYCILIPLPLLDRLIGTNLITPTNDSTYLLPLLLVHAALYTFCMGCVSVAVMSMLADVIDQHALKTGHVQSAIFYSSRTFFAKVSYSTVGMVMGYLLNGLVGLEPGAVPDKSDPDMISTLGWVYVAGCLGGVIAAFAYGRYRLSKREHEKIRRQLDERESTPI
jgi:Na+/melibiose symporter-like transporter